MSANVSKTLAEKAKKARAKGKKVTAQFPLQTDETGERSAVGSNYELRDDEKDFCCCSPSCYLCLLRSGCVRHCCWLHLAFVAVFVIVKVWQPIRAPRRCTTATEPTPQPPQAVQLALAAQAGPGVLPWAQTAACGPTSAVWGAMNMGQNAIGHPPVGPPCGRQPQPKWPLCQLGPTTNLWQWANANESKKT